MSDGAGLKIGVQVPEVERRVGWAEYVEIATTAEAGGLDSLWVGDHLLYDLRDGTTRGPWECWTLLAGLAAVTERVTLAPLVASTSFHAPAMLAKMASTVDEISGGRLIVGLGAGWNRREYEAYGFPFDRRVSRFEEAFTIIRTLFDDGRIDFHGEFHELNDCVLDPPARPGGPPLLIGSNGPRMLEIALPHVDMWNTWFDDYDNDPARLPALIGQIDAAAIAVGRDPAAIAKTAAMLFQFSETSGRRNSQNPVVGRAHMVESLHRMEEIGLAHLQLVLDPMTVETTATVAEIVQEFRSR